MTREEVESEWKEGLGRRSTLCERILLRLLRNGGARPALLFSLRQGIGVEWSGIAVATMIMC